MVDAPSFLSHTQQKCRSHVAIIHAMLKAGRKVLANAPEAESAAVTTSIYRAMAAEHGSTCR
jgi:hypothetical protein